MSNETKNWDEQFTYLFKVTQEKEKMPAPVLIAKTAEELGELSEVTLYKSGYLQHKTKEFESPFGEAADIINCIVGTLAVLHPEMTPEQLNAELFAAFQRKGNKYVNILTK